MGGGKCGGRCGKGVKTHAFGSFHVRVSVATHAFVFNAPRPLLLATPTTTAAAAATAAVFHVEL